MVLGAPPPPLVLPSVQSEPPGTVIPDAVVLLKLLLRAGALSAGCCCMGADERPIIINAVSSSLEAAVPRRQRAKRTGPIRGGGLLPCFSCSAEVFCTAPWCRVPDDEEGQDEEWLVLVLLRTSRRASAKAVRGVT